MDLAERIRALRQRKGLSQEALAEQMEVSRQAVAKWERGAARPSTDRLLRLSQVLEVPLEELTGVERPAPRPRAAPLVWLGAALLLGCAAAAARIIWGESAVPEGVIGYADGPTGMYVSGGPVLAWILGALAALALLAAAVTFLMGTRKGRER